MTRTTSGPVERFPERMRSAAAALRLMGRHTVLFHDAVAERLGLNATDSRALSYLADVGSATAGDLAILTGLTTGAVTRIVDRLEEAGLVRREPDPTDRRRVIVTPVEDGEPARRMRELFEPFGRAVERLLEEYSDRELELIADFNERAADLLYSATHALESEETGAKASPTPSGAESPTSRHRRPPR